MKLAMYDDSFNKETEMSKSVHTSVMLPTFFIGTSNIRLSNGDAIYVDRTDRFQFHFWILFNCARDVEQFDMSKENLNVVRNAILSVGFSADVSFNVRRKNVWQWTVAPVRMRFPLIQRQLKQKKVNKLNQLFVFFSLKSQWTEIDAAVCNYLLPLKMECGGQSST